MYETEALSWLTKSDCKNLLAANRFQTREDAIEGIKKLYAAGAVRVVVEVERHDPEYVKRNGGEYSERIIVFGVPQNKDKIKKVIQELRPEGLGYEYGLDDWDGRQIGLFWD